MKKFEKKRKELAMKGIKHMEKAHDMGSPKDYSWAAWGKKMKERKQNG